MDKEEKAFREKYNCRNCSYYKKPRRCFAEKICPLEEGEIPRLVNKIKSKLPKCPKDKVGDCPYGNENGTCFGFCWLDILKEYRERKKQNEQIKKVD